MLLVVWFLVLEVGRNRPVPTIKFGGDLTVKPKEPHGFRTVGVLEDYAVLLEAGGQCAEGGGVGGKN